MKKIYYTLIIALLSVIASPVFAKVAASTQPRDFKQLINNVFIAGIIKPIVPLLIGLGVIVFIYGVLILMFSEGGEKKEEGKQYMFWGIIGIFVMVSVWGLVNILISTFSLPNTKPTIQMQIPTVRVTNS